MSDSAAASAQPFATRLSLIRHGESEAQRLRVVGGIRGCTGLSADGVVQVQALADRLASTAELGGANALYASVLPRAIQTAELIAPCLGHLPVMTDCGLCELHPGQGDGLSWADLEATYPVPDFVTHPDLPFSPGGESWTTFLARARAALLALVGRHRGEQVVVATHGGVIDGSLLSFLGISGVPGRAAGGGAALGATNASITEWEHQAGRWRLLRYNDTAHLPRRGSK